MFDKISSTRVKSFLKHENYTPLNVKGNESTNDVETINKYQSVDHINHHGLGYYFREKGVFERDPSDTKTE